MPSPAEADNAATAMPHNSILLQAQEFFIIRILINMFLLSTLHHFIFSQFFFPLLHFTYIYALNYNTYYVLHSYTACHPA